ncbi:MAG: NAD-dependent epimerase/dehydratase family protein [Legionellales bacterium]|nr:NAD-dependent epimerase/dehydratase family protein [Legionellales bacterium]
MKKNTILISGGAGAIGFQLAKVLANRGDEIYIADNFIRSENDDEFKSLVSNSNVHAINIDLSDIVSCERHLPDSVDYIYHMAAFNGTQNFYEHSFQVLLHSTLPTIHLIKIYGLSKRLKRFIYAGSSEAYASTITRFDWEIPTSEDVPLGIEDPLNPRWSYGGSKMHGELACVAANSEFEMPFTVLRYHNVFGPRMGDRHIVPDFIARAKQGKFELFGYDDTRSFIYVADAVNSTIAAAESELSLNQIIHLGSDEEIKIIDLAKMMMKIMGLENEIILHTSPKGSVKRRSPNIAKLKHMIDFSPKISLEEGLRKTITYYAPELIAK